MIINNLETINRALLYIHNLLICNIICNIVSFICCFSLFFCQKLTFESWSQVNVDYNSNSISDSVESSLPNIHYPNISISKHSMNSIFHYSINTIFTPNNVRVLRKLIVKLKRLTSRTFFQIKKIYCDII